MLLLKEVVYETVHNISSSALDNDGWKMSNVRHNTDFNETLADNIVF